MTTPATRLREARIEAGYSSAREAADRLGMQYPTYSSHENGSRGITARAARDYAKAFKTTAEWILYGSGEPPVRVENGDNGPNGSRLVSVYDVQGSAGFGAIVDTYEAVSHSLAFPSDYIAKITRANPRNLAIISVKGDSMYPTLKDDDVVMLDSSKTNLSFDGLFVLRFGDALHVKRVTHSSRPGYVTILSDNNSSYPPQDWPLEEVHVVGKVIWRGGKV